MPTTTRKPAVKKVAAAKTASTNGRPENYQVVTVTPELAQSMLERNDHNRKLDTKHLNFLTLEMTEGRWHFDGSPIRFAIDGTLLDGQHRLHAVIDSGTTQKFLMVGGLPVKAQSTMDTNKRRTAGNMLQILGYGGYGASIAAAARLALIVEKYGLNTEKNFNSTLVSNQEVVDFAEAHSELIEVVKEIQKFYRRTDIPSVSVVAYAYWRMSQIDQDTNAAFWETAAEKIGAEAGNPALTMANRFADARRQRERLDYRAQLSMIFRAWNAYREGKKIYKLPTRRGFEAIATPELV